MGSNPRTELVSKPFPNEHAARQMSPTAFRPKSFRRAKLNLPNGVEAIVGIPKGDKDTVIQSIRFDARIWTPDKARAWLRRNGFTVSTFEAAKKPTQKDSSKETPGQWKHEINKRGGYM